MQDRAQLAYIGQGILQQRIAVLKRSISPRIVRPLRPAPQRLRVKVLGLHMQPYPTDRALHGLFGLSQHIIIAKQAGASL